MFLSSFIAQPEVSLIKSELSALCIAAVTTLSDMESCTFAEMLLIAFQTLRVEKLPLLRLKELETIAHKAVVSNDKSIMGLLIVNQESGSDAGWL